MVCDLPRPRWENLYRVGLQSAVENLALQRTVISWALANPTYTAPFVYYNIYWSDDLLSLFEQPRAFAEDRLTANIPYTLAGDGYYFGVKAAQLGVSDDFSVLSPMSINDTMYGYPASRSTLSLFSTALTTANIQVASTSGYPLTDGYLQIGDEIVLYNSVGTAGGNPAFIINNWDPFGCNDGYDGYDGYNYPIGTTVQLFRGFEDANAVAFERIGGCSFELAEWADNYRPGIQFVEDLGLGSVIKATWLEAITPFGMSDTYYNIYYSSLPDDLFNAPKALTDQLSVSIPGLHGGDGYYFGVRATYHPQGITLSGFASTNPGYYRYPTGITVNETDGYYHITETTPLRVSPNTTGFPNSGYLKVGDEILAYTSKTSTTFVISQRDVFSLGRTATHLNGVSVIFFRGLEDLNQSYLFAVPTWDGSENGPWLPADPSDPDGYASMQDSDGYRAWLIDNLHEDHSEFEDENIDHTNQDDLCGGYRAGTTDLTKLYTGQLCGTYFGGRETGVGGGINLTDSNLRRQEMLINQTGEPFTLLRLKTTGRQCPKWTLHGEHSFERCSLCLGTRILGGYDRYIHPRLYRANIENPNGMVSMRVQPYRNDLPLLQNRGLSQVDELQLWLPAVPVVKKRDIIIRYEPIDPGDIPIEEFRYEVVHVERNRLLFGADGKQSLQVRKLDKTHEIYTFPASVVAADAIT